MSRVLVEVDDDLRRWEQRQREIEEEHAAYERRARQADGRHAARTRKRLEETMRVLEYGRRPVRVPPLVVHDERTYLSPAQIEVLLSRMRAIKRPEFGDRISTPYQPGRASWLQATAEE